MERAMGLEPTTSSLGSWHSTAELRPRFFKKLHLGSAQLLDRLQFRLCLGNILLRVHVTRIKH